MKGEGVSYRQLERCNLSATLIPISLRYTGVSLFSTNNLNLCGMEIDGSVRDIANWLDKGTGDVKKERVDIFSVK